MFMKSLAIISQVYFLSMVSLALPPILFLKYLSAHNIVIICAEGRMLGFGEPD